MKFIKRVIIAVVGGTILLIGVIMIVLPGPAILVIPAGLAILAIEFAWARRWLQTTKEYLAKITPGKGPREKAAELPKPASPPVEEKR